MADATRSQPGPDEPWIELAASRYFPAWLAQERVSLAFTTYQTAKLFLLGRRVDGQLAVCF